jgi:hypothetical protein
MSENESDPDQQLTVTRPARDIVAEISARVVIPAMIADAGLEAEDIGERKYCRHCGLTHDASKPPGWSVGE